MSIRRYALSSLTLVFFVLLMSQETQIKAAQPWLASQVGIVQCSGINKTLTDFLGGQPIVNDAVGAVISANERYVAFGEFPTRNLSVVKSIYLSDLLTKKIVIASIDWNGNPANGESWGPAISYDGRIVAFTSNGNLISGLPRSNRAYAYDMQTGKTELISVDNDGTPLDDNGQVSISNDGRYVAFGGFAVYVRDRVLETTEMISVDPNGQQGNGRSVYPKISADGRYVAFESDASNLVPNDTNNTWDVFVRDRQSGQTTRVSVASDGTEGNGSSGVIDPGFNTTQQDVSISDDGRYVVFLSSASNLVPNDTNGKWDIFVHDNQTGSTTRVSVASNGAQANGDSGIPSAISANGQYIVFTSLATNLVPNDINNNWDVFIRDIQTQQTSRISVAPDCTDGNDASGAPDPGENSLSITPDGRYVAYYSYATNIVASGSSGEFIWDKDSVATESPDISLVGPITIRNKEYPFSANHLTFIVGVSQPGGSFGRRVQVDLFDGNPNSGGSSISPAVIMTLTPGQTVNAQFEYALPGNIENHILYARVLMLDGYVDPNPSNNTISAPFSAYFVDYRHDRDAYKFPQESVGAIPESEIGNFFSSYQIPEWVYSPMLPVVGLAIEAYTGYCYGMADSSLVYYLFPTLRPNYPDTTYNLTIDQARASIRTYQWYTVIPSLRAIMTIHYDALSAFNDTVNNLKQGIPVMHALIQRQGLILRGGSHAVVAYKAVSLGDEHKVFYIDSNFPLDSAGYHNTLKSIQQETFGDFSSSGFSDPFYPNSVPPIYFTEAHVMGVQLTRTDDTRVLLDFIRWIYGYLSKDGLISVSLDGQFNFLAVDGQGRRAGIQSSQILNEIPGAQLTQTDKGLTMLLPTNGSYQFQVTPNIVGLAPSSANSALTLSVVDPITDHDALLLEVKNVALPAGSQAMANFTHGQTELQLSMSNGTNYAAFVTALLAPPIQTYLPMINH